MTDTGIETVSAEHRIHHGGEKSLIGHSPESSWVVKMLNDSWAVTVKKFSICE
jgi:hypothetical protein